MARDESQEEKSFEYEEIIFSFTRSLSKMNHHWTEDIDNTHGLDEKREDDEWSKNNLSLSEEDI